MWPFGETVLLWRLYRGLSQAELAAAAGVTRPNLSAIESGQREASMGTLPALALALKTEPGTLAGGKSPYGTTGPLSRAALERIAAAAVGGQPPTPGVETELAGFLRTITATRLAAHNNSAHPKQSRLATTQAYLQLKAMTSTEVINSLLARMEALMS
jgi:transcriptional regulator with XRE-family HTH domain